MRTWARLAAMAAIATSVAATSALAENVKIAFIVKQPEEPWFQDEWKFADQAAAEKGFTLVKIGAEDGEKALAALDNAGVQGVQGVIICVPDVKLGPGVVARARANELKLMTVDDRLVDAKGNPIESVPHMGISAGKIGEEVGSAIAAEAKRRGWDLAEVGAVRVSYDQLPTAKDRVDGAIAALEAAGLPKANVFDAPQAKTDTESALNAATIVLNREGKYKRWIAFGLNDEAALGAVRASEGAGIPAANVIAVGIGGSDAAINEFKKPGATGFYGSVIISPKRHGYETALLMYDWVSADQAPAKLTLTSGELATRSDYAQVRAQLGLQ